VRHDGATGTKSANQSDYVIEPFADDLEFLESAKQSVVLQDNSKTKVFPFRFAADIGLGFGDKALEGAPWNLDPDCRKDST
jgi:hypothetical protein